MPFLRKYGVGTGADIIIPLIKAGEVNFAATGDYTPASGDVKISKDGGSEANIGTLPVINGTYGWKFVFADAELEAKSITIRLADSATKAVEDQFIVIETYGHASAMYKPDFSDSVRLGLTALPNAAADAAGGLVISDAGGFDVDNRAPDATAVANLNKSAGAIVTGTVTTGASTTSVPTSACSPSGAAADQFKGRILIFLRDTTTTALRGQATDITASSNSATPTFTVTALTTAPASGDTFVIV